MNWHLEQAAGQRYWEVVPSQSFSLKNEIMKNLKPLLQEPMDKWMLAQKEMLKFFSKDLIMKMVFDSCGCAYLLLTHPRFS